MVYTNAASFSGRTAALCTPAQQRLASTRAPPGSCRDGVLPAPSCSPRCRFERCARTSAALVEDAPVLPGGKGSGMESVGDVMTYNKVFSVRPDTTIDEALDILVSNRITGLPVLDDQEKVVGIVSDFDLLSLDHISGERTTSGIFPDVSTDWQSFQEVQKLILKNHGKLVEDVMTAEPVVVSRETSLEDAARTLLEKRIRRLPVVDPAGKLIGMFSRGDVIKAAVQTRKQIKSVSGSLSEDI